VRYIRLSTYDLRKGDFNELAALFEATLLPMYSREPGFVRFGLIDAGHNKVIAMTIWEHREHAERSAWLAVEWIRENISDRVRLVNTYHGSMALYDELPLSAPSDRVGDTQAERPLAGNSLGQRYRAFGARPAKG
jgi:hypothetical protein